MKYLFLSDIHGSLPALDAALGFYRRERCDMLCLLGDVLNYGPRNGLPTGLDPHGIADRLNAMADEIVAVRGNCDSEVDQMLLHFHLMDTSLLLVDEGRRVLLTHGHIYNKVNMPQGRYDAVVYGHTHRWELTRQDGLTVCNTGSPTFPKDGNPPTLATLADGIITVYTLQGEPLKSLHI